jgi:hypothetical protein
VESELSRAIWSRVLEPSSWAGAAGLLLAARPMLPGAWAHVADAGAALCGAVAVALRERGGG